jgi:hypothetical protein
LPAPKKPENLLPEELELLSDELLFEGLEILNDDMMLSPASGVALMLCPRRGRRPEKVTCERRIASKRYIIKSIV